MKIINGFENEDIIVSDFGEWVGKNYIDYKSEYKNNQKIIKILLEENQKLKKQLEELKSTNKVLSEELTKDKILKQDCLTTCCGIPIGDIPKLKTQQKEFINYLEDEIKKATTNPYTKLSEYGMNRIHIYKEILQKYKEIIGDDK